MVAFIQNTPIYFKVPARLIKQGFCPATSDELDGMLDALDDSQRGYAILECAWQLLGKPYFEVYPKVLEALIKTDLEVRPSQIPRSIVHDMKYLCVKFPVKMLDFTHMLMLIHKNHLHVVAVSQVGEKTVFYESHASDNSPFTSASEFSEIPLSVTSANAVRSIALGVLLLANDPEYIRPIVLKQDHGKPNLGECVARARRRGVFGFTVGESVERCPHFRKPHFAIRWTGKGASVPKLVPVKGAVIRKQLMTTVPTGYESPDSTDGDIA